MRRFQAPIFAAVALLCTPAIFGQPAESKQLHVMLFVGTAPQAGDGAPEIIRLPDGRLPEVASRMLVPTLNQDFPIDFEDYPLDRSTLVIDVCTLSFSASDIRQGRKKDRDNGLMGSNVEIAVAQWTDDDLRFTLRVRYRDFDSAPIAVAGAPGGTTLIRLGMPSGERLLPLLAAVTPATAIPLLLVPVLTATDSVTSEPIPRVQTVPPGVSRTRRRRRGRRPPRRVRLATVINREGRIDAKRLVVLECNDPAFVDPLFWSISNEWEFQPAVRDDAPVEARVLIKAEHSLSFAVDLDFVVE